MLPLTFAATFVFLALLGLLGAILALAWHAKRITLGRTTYASMDAFIESVSRELGLKGERVGASVFARLEDARFTGPIGTRSVHVTFENRGRSSQESFDYARIAIAAPDVPQLSVTVEGFTSRIGKAIGLQQDLEVGDKEFDDRFLVQSLEPTRAKALLAREAVRRTIQSAFAHYGIEKLECIRGTVAAFVPMRELKLGEYRSLVENVVRIAETLSLHVTVQGGEGAHARCGYCHEETAPDALDVVACEVCRTITHKACRAELGRCPVAGCGGSAPERVAVRA